MDTFEYRWEEHQDPAAQRVLMLRLGREGWEFVGFVNHWGPFDGRTMLFKRCVDRAERDELPEEPDQEVREEALDEIAKLAKGTSDWQYPWQVVRAVEELARRVAPQNIELRGFVVDEKPEAVVRFSDPSCPHCGHPASRHAKLNTTGCAAASDGEDDKACGCPIDADTVRDRGGKRPHSLIVEQAQKDADALTAAVADLAGGGPAKESRLSALAAIAERIQYRGKEIESLIVNLDDARATRDQRWEKAKRAEHKLYEAHREKLNLAAESQRLEAALETEREKANRADDARFQAENDCLRLHDKLKETRRERDEAITEKDNAYAQRNIAVVTLARMALRAGCNAGRMIDHAADHGWRHVVVVDLPTGQVTWHFPDSDAQWTGSLPYYEGAWDGHSTVEKNRRCLTFAQMVEPERTTLSPRPGSRIFQQALIDLLDKLDAGEGGRRTGELWKLGWLRWEVTTEGKRALGARASKTPSRTAGEIDKANEVRFKVPRYTRDSELTITLGEIVQGLVDRVDQGDGDESLSAYLDETLLLGAWGPQFVELPLNMQRDLRAAIIKACTEARARVVKRARREQPHGLEAESLRRGVEEILASLEGSEMDGLDVERDLRNLLDHVDAGDSLALLRDLHHDACREMSKFREELRSGKYTRSFADYSIDELVGTLWLVGEMKARLLPRDFCELYGRTSPSARVRSAVAAAALADGSLVRITVDRARWLMRKAVRLEAYVNESGLVLPAEES